jgi:hypothetical protein
VDNTALTVARYTAVVKRKESSFYELYGGCPKCRTRDNTGLVFGNHRMIEFYLYLWAKYVEEQLEIFFFFNRDM